MFTTIWVKLMTHPLGPYLPKNRADLNAWTEVNAWTKVPSTLDQYNNHHTKNVYVVVVIFV